WMLRDWWGHKSVQLKLFAKTFVEHAGGNEAAQSAQCNAPAYGITKFRPWRESRFQHGIGHDTGFISRLEERLHLLAQGRADLAILIELCVGLQQVRIEFRVRVRRLDDRDPNAPGAQLVVERFRITFDRVLPR